MRNYYALLVLSFVFFSSNLSNIFAQKDDKSFRGTITYSLKYEGDLLEPAMMAQLPGELVIKIHGNKIKTEVNQGGFLMTVIKDCEKKNIIALMDMSSMIGKKIMTRMSEDDLKKDLEKMPSVTTKFYDDIKEIAGYKSKKGELISKDENGNDVVSVFYYTDELGLEDRNFDTPFRDVKGVLMEYEERSDRFTMKAVATRIKKQRLSELEFAIPEGYEELSNDQLKEIFGR